MFRHIKQAIYMFYKAGDNLVENDGIELAGYLTFLSLLALFPFLVLIVSAAGFIGEGQLGTRFLELVVSGLPEKALAAIKPRVDEIMSGPPQGLLTISILGAIWTSSSAVEGLRTVLNRAYEVSNPPTYVLRRLLSIFQIILFTAIIIIVMSVTVLSPLLIDYAETLLERELSGEFTSIWNQYFFYFGGALLFVTVANLYYFLPNIKQSLFAVVPGAMLTVLFWLVGASIFTLYISNVEQVNIIYGSLGGFIATLLFFFILNVIFIYGAEFNHLLNKAIGIKMEEREHVDKSEDISLTDHKSR